MCHHVYVVRIKLHLHALCDLDFSCLSTSIISPEVSGCQNNKCIQIQYGQSCLHFLSSNFNFVNLRQLLTFPCANQLKGVNFVCIIQNYCNKFIYIYMNFRIKVIFHYECLATQCRARRHLRWVWLSAALGASSPQNFSCMINVLPDKKLKYYNVNVNYKNISDYMLFFFFIQTSSIKNIRPL